METGLLWFDNDAARSIEEKVRRAAEHYRARHGHTCDVCFVPPAVLADNEPLQVDGVQVRAGRAILPHHFWLGVLEEMLNE
ncbi:MAG: hypothetical protein JW900_08100 [Anaerolineae bacterium]|nr:hypothetical protein [Anaerolineae bacterium]